MPRRVTIAGDARDDLRAIYAYATEHDSPDRAENLLTRLRAAVLSLADMPLRGHVPAEMRLLGMKDYREIHDGPYRIIYRVWEDQVVVYAIADGRRDMQAFLHRRLTR